MPLSIIGLFTEFSSSYGLIFFSSLIHWGSFQNFTQYILTLVTGVLIPTDSYISHQQYCDKHLSIQNRCFCRMSQCQTGQYTKCEKAEPCNDIVRFYLQFTHSITNYTQITN